jgi:hypothetical protein
MIPVVVFLLRVGSDICLLSAFVSNSNYLNNIVGGYVAYPFEAAGLAFGNHFGSSFDHSNEDLASHYILWSVDFSIRYLHSTVVLHMP